MVKRQYVVIGKALNMRNKLGSVSDPRKIKSKLDFGWVSLFSMGITVLVAVLFGAGKAYRQQFLAGFSFSDTVVPWSFQDVVYLGITKQLPILLAAPVAATAAIFIFALMAGGLMWLDARIAARRLNTPNKNRKQNEKLPSGESFLRISEFLLICFGWITLLSLLALFFVARAEQLGKSDAKLAQESIEKRETVSSLLNHVKIVRFVGGRVIEEEGYLVTCGEKMCGIYSHQDDRAVSVLVPLDNVLSFQYQ